MEYTREELNNFDILPIGAKIFNFTIVEFLKETYIPDAKMKQKYKQKYMCLCENCGKTTQQSRKHLIYKKFHTCRYCGTKHLDYLEPGMKFGRLTILKVDTEANKNNKRNGVSYWKYKCECSCGNIISVPKHALVNRQTESCGCLAIDNIIESCSKTNEYENLDNGITKVKYTNIDEYFLIDTEDWIKFKHLCWFSDRGYAMTSRGNKDKVPNLFLHRSIMGDPKGYLVDHENGKPYLNCKSNLRVTKRKGNVRNRKVTNKFGVSGISLYTDGIRYKVEISLDNKTKRLGLYKDLQEAKQVRFNAELYYYGEYSPLLSRDIYLDHNLIVPDEYMDILEIHLRRKEEHAYHLLNDEENKK